MPKKDNSRVHYEQFHNIFLYITERCQLRCGHCYMGDRLERGLKMDYNRAIYIIECCSRLGARYITFLGGEPALHPDLPRLVDYAKEVGYQQVMIDSNGLLLAPILKIPPEKLWYISISLDGATPESHDRVRGEGTFEKTCSTIESLVKSGYSVRINCTVFKFNVQEAPLLLSLADKLGVGLVNFHTFSEEGYGRERADWSLSPTDWIDFYESLDVIRGSYAASIWYPPTWATKDKLDMYAKQGYRGCLGCSLDRLSIFPDGRCYVCSVLFDTPLHFATITDGVMVLNRGRNEFDMFTRAALRAGHPSLMGCPAEQLLGGDASRNPDEIVSVCRCWKSQV